MNIILQDIGRRYNREWIFRNLNYEFISGNGYAILGPNGSGKSTLVKLLTSSLSPSEGSIRYAKDGSDFQGDQMYQHIGIAAPYVDLIEEFTLLESLDFHFRFKPILPGYDRRDLIHKLGFPDTAQDRAIKFFSSGMKQRLKLLLACFSDTAILFLDEPTSNLDRQGEQWYRGIVTESRKDRLLIVGSNQEQEYDWCEHHLQILDYK
ncbi:MAG: ABC transporter ATP-binding protein [Sphingobacterium sp.]